MESVDQTWINMDPVAKMKSWKREEPKYGANIVKYGATR